jgi:hypothetical protein
VFETRGSTQPNVAAQAFFSRSLLCHATIILIRSFLFYQLPSRFRAPVLAQMTDGPPRSTSYCASALSCRPLVISCLLPYFSIRHCQYLLNLASPSRDSILMVNMLSQSTLSPAKNAFRLPVSSDFFCPLFPHRLLDSSSSCPLPFPSGHF